MNREIKFRQPIRNKDGSFKEWFYWDIFSSPAIQQNGLDTRKESQQFTGLLDKDKNPIFQGDILRRYTGHKFIASVGEFALGSPHQASCFGYHWHEGDEIIGNTIENPNLL
jgi:hypothetical protein